MIYTGIFYWILRGMEPWTLKHKGNSNILNASIDIKYLYMEKNVCVRCTFNREYNLVTGFLFPPLFGSVGGPGCTAQ